MQARCFINRRLITKTRNKLMTKFIRLRVKLNLLQIMLKISKMNSDAAPAKLSIKKGGAEFEKNRVP